MVFNRNIKILFTNKSLVLYSGFNLICIARFTIKFLDILGVENKSTLMPYQEKNACPLGFKKQLSLVLNRGFNLICIAKFTIIFLNIPDVENILPLMPYQEKNTAKTHFYFEFWKVLYGNCDSKQKNMICVH